MRVLKLFDLAGVSTAAINGHEQAHLKSQQADFRERSFAAALELAWFGCAATAMWVSPIRTLVC